MGRILDILRGKQITSLEAAVDLISARFEIVQDLITETIHDVAALKCSILAVPADQRTYANTVLAYDELCGVNIVLHAITSILRCVSADIAQRDIPYEVRKKEMAALIHDPALYEALREYRNGPMEYEVLTTEQYVYVETLMDHGRRSGYDQAEEQRWQLAALKKQMDAAASSFESNYRGLTLHLLPCSREMRRAISQFCVILLPGTPLCLIAATQKCAVLFIRRIISVRIRPMRVRSSNC
jgi:Zn-dependent oligopeptidase